MIDNCISHFPAGYTPADHQIILIKRIENAFKSGKKFVIVNAPTGSGKSFLGKTISGTCDEPSSKFTSLIRTYDAFRQDYGGVYTNEAECSNEKSHGSFVLTITKSLQDQYATLFDDTHVAKGKSNYMCDVDPNFDVETAPCVTLHKLKDECWEKNRCPYYKARNDAILSRFSALNYKMFLALPAHVKKKSFIICDEASELEDELVRQFSAEIIYQRLKSCGVVYDPLYSDDYSNTRTWISEIAANITNRVNELTTKLSKKRSTFSAVDKTKLSYLKNLHSSLSTVDKLWTETEFVIDRTGLSVNIMPLYVNSLSHHVFGHADKVLLMSATIIDYKHFAKTLGITDYEYIEAPSEFDSKKSPIYASTKYRLNYEGLKKALPAVTEQIKQICKHHKNEKGIIHTHTMSIANFMKDALGDDIRFLFRSETDNNESILNSHYTTDEPTVLVSPSLTHGVDLKDDLARFQIIVKLPYLPLSQKRIKRLFDIDKDWYENKMLNSLVQASGRATRGIDDHSVTYIMDANIVDVLKRTKHKLPAHFVDRFH